MNTTLKNSKTLWGFGIMIAIFAVKQLLLQAGIVIPGTHSRIAVDMAAYLAGFWGIYGLRDVLRKIQINTFLSE